MKSPPSQPQSRSSEPSDRHATPYKLRKSAARGERAPDPRRRGLAVAAALLLAACQGEAPLTGALRALPRPDANGRLLIADAGFAAPTAAVYDSVGDVYLVANAGTANAGRDSAAQSEGGFISRVGPDGRMLTLKWVQGSKTSPLHAPKGLAFKGDTLLVADVGAVRMYDRSTGVPLESRVVAGGALEGVAVGPDGTVYVSAGGAPSRTPDTASGTATGPAAADPTWPAAIYRLGRHEAFPVARGAALGRPNGLVADAGGLIVAPSDGRTLYRVGLHARGGQNALRPTPLATLPQPTLNGLLRLPDGDLVATSWAGRAVYRVRPNGRVETILTDIDAPGQPGLDPQRGRLLVPLLRQQALLIAPLRR